MYLVRYNDQSGAIIAFRLRGFRASRFAGSDNLFDGSNVPSSTRRSCVKGIG